MNDIDTMLAKQFLLRVRQEGYSLVENPPRSLDGINIDIYRGETKICTFDDRQLGEWCLRVRTDDSTREEIKSDYYKLHDMFINLRDLFIVSETTVKNDVLTSVVPCVKSDELVQSGENCEVLALPVQAENSEVHIVEGGETVEVVEVVGVVEVVETSKKAHRKHGTGSLWCSGAKFGICVQLGKADDRHSAPGAAAPNRSDIFQRHQPT